MKILRSFVLLVCVPWAVIASVNNNDQVLMDQLKELYKDSSHLEKARDFPLAKMILLLSRNDVYCKSLKNVVHDVLTIPEGQNDNIEIKVELIALSF